MSGGKGEALMQPLDQRLQGLRVAHIGNIANNAYLNAKFLRELGLQADALNFDYRHIMAQPEWEEAEIDGVVDQSTPDWGKVHLNGYQRPDWFKDVELKRFDVCGQEKRGMAAWGYHAERYKTRAAQYLEKVGVYKNPANGWTYPAAWSDRIKATLIGPPAFMLYVAGRFSERFDRVYAKWDDWSPRQRMFVQHLLDTGKVSSEDLNWALPRACKMRGLISSYDLVQAYGIEPIYTMLLSGGAPYIAFEHGTMRDLPFEPTPMGRLLAQAYKQAARVIITNPDVINSAKRLGLKNTVFIPHPINDDMSLSPQNDVIAEMRSLGEDALVCLAPARQNWALKGNDIMLKGFSDILRSGKKAYLYIAEWGQEVSRSQRLVRELGIDAHVRWYQPAHKRLLRALFKTADVILDQLVLGSFGGITPEAMSLGKPVLLYYDKKIQEWCFPVPPPIMNVHTRKGVAEALSWLYDNVEGRQEMGRRACDWYHRYHSKYSVVSRHVDIYRDVIVQLDSACA